MAVVVLDASVLIAFRDPADALHTRAVATFRAYRTDSLVLPASVYAEVLVGPLRHGVAAVESLHEFISDFGIRVEPLSRSMARRAAELRAQFPTLRLPDALVLATAEVLDASVVTGDVAWSRFSTHARLI